MKVFSLQILLLIFNVIFLHLEKLELPLELLVLCVEVFGLFGCLIWPCCCRHRLGGRSKKIKMNVMKTLLENTVRKRNSSAVSCAIAGNCSTVRRRFRRARHAVQWTRAAIHYLDHNIQSRCLQLFNFHIEHPIVNRSVRHATKHLHRFGATKRCTVHEWQAGNRLVWIERLQ